MEKEYFKTTDIIMKSVNDKTRVVEFIASKEIVDRGGDVVNIKGIDIKNFKKNPVILWSHDRNGLPVGKANSVRKSGDELIMKVEFPTEEEYAFGDTVFKLIKGGYINATSIGIIPDYDSMEYPDNKKIAGKSIRRLINKSEIFELSIVPVPMNQEALATGKSLTKALDEGLINQDDYDKLTTEEDIELETKDLKEENIELKSQLAAMELLLKEQEMEAEEEDSIYKDLFDEFTEDKKIPDDSIAELYKMFTDLDEKEEHINDKDILNGYFE
jgi:HK97 family phage prohead protease